MNALEEFIKEKQVVLLLVGLIGSGKSTFAEALQEHVPNFRRCNQDDLGDRRRVESLARLSLSQGLSVCIDRTNFDEAQRATWIKIAREYLGTYVWVIVFDTPYEVCIERLRVRTNHPTIKTPTEALSVLSRFQSQYYPPAPHEGHTRILNLRTPDQSPAYTRAHVLAILQRVRDAPSIDPATASRHEPSTRGRGYRGLSRGRGYRDSWSGAGGYRDSARGYGARGYNTRESSPYSRPGRSDAGSWRQGGSYSQRRDDDRDRRYRRTDA
ncbi:P-loop containing nucleoside triphosphate hydrolase protein [Sparassis latifolia]|uniref:P-loop containing nucleoside triphosphate hydrolase protein n=1 Tax=Sparassis crispa TaxID=139825 RepID=A0A401H3X0_9APHY|nr:hypothetical protein SCP_1501330 [Sparassis crispa]GBE89128.1 hypothetical protein SCP_1501330 [Sparassis crispa]